jgi:diguanylate cyclase
MSIAAPLSSLPETRELRFVGRIYVLRLLGVALGALSVGAVLYEQHAPNALWALLLCHAAVWPHVASRRARHARDPRRAELRNLEIDSALGGAWIALMHFALVPSVVAALMLSVDKVHVGGVRLLLRCIGWQALGCAIALLASTLLSDSAPFMLQSSPLVIACTLPLLIGYPLAIGAATHAMLRRSHALNLRLENLSRTDAMTGMSNRAFWQQCATRELRRFERSAQPATLLLIDIDAFKSINDGYGHAAGDEAIRAVARTIRECVREVDLCGRYGGDEFGVVLVHATSAGARLVAERIRSRIAGLQQDDLPPLSVSIGVAEAEAGMRDIGAWAERADVALYRAKARGRNRVATISPAEFALESLQARRSESRAVQCA